jgi:PBSX family phage terminase large subunit
MILHPSQAVIAKDKSRFRVICCGRRWGKTTLAVEEIKGKALYTESTIAYIAPTIQQARDIAWEMLKKELREITVKCKEAPSLELEVRNLKGTTSIIKLRGWEAVETLRGQAFDMLVIDEVASMRNFWTGWEEVLRPTLTDRKGDVIFISTPKGYNHFYTLYQKAGEDTDYKSFHYTSYDNPYLNREEIEKAKAELPENKFVQEYMADFRKVEGLVYNVNESEYVEDLELNIKTEKRIMGVDWGYRNPAAIWIGYLRDNVWYTVDEWKVAERTTAEIIQVMQNKIKEHRITQVYPDPAEPDRIEECRRASIPVYDTCKDIEGGVSYIQTLIKEHRFKICNGCRYFKEEINTYQYPEEKEGRLDKEVPEKLNDHLMDAMRYAIYSNQGKSTHFNTASPLKYDSIINRNKPASW